MYSQKLYIHDLLATFDTQTSITSKLASTLGARALARYYASSILADTQANTISATPQSTTVPILNLLNLELLYV